MMSPNQIRDHRSSSNPATFRQTPLQVIHFIANLMRIWSVYTMYHYLSQTGTSVVLFLFSCLVPSSILLLLLQRPWKGRPLSNTQVVPSVINGAITALFFILWGKALKSCGPRRTILAEYFGAILGVISAVLYGGRGDLYRKIGGLFSMFASFYLLSKGWGAASFTQLPFSFSEENFQTEAVIGVKDMLIPIFAGILSALRRVIARRVSLKNQLKRRLHAITIASAASFMFPVAMWDVIGSTRIALPFSAWTFSSTVLFGIILIFYVESIAEERLLMVFSSARHLTVAVGCIILMEIVYQMDFSLPGFLLCATILSFGVHEATSLDRMKKDSLQNSDLSNGVYEDRISMAPLPS